MERAAMTEYVLRTRYWLEGIGWPGITGLALCVLSVVIAATAITARLAELDALRAENRGLHERLATDSVQSKAKATREEELLAFYGFFPPLSTLPDWLERIYGAAEKNGVALEVGEYRLVQEKGWRLARYQLNLPVKGSYGQIRGFIAQVLTDVPASALEEIGFRRDTVGTDRVDVRLRLTLYLGRA
jgi:Tfp pilus assembly protein PilO